MADKTKTVLCVLLVAIAAAVLLPLGYTGYRAYSASQKADETIRAAIATLDQTTITNSFAAYGTKIHGTTRLQVATLNEKWIFERKSEWAPFWIPFPDVVVRAEAPVEVTYYVDLNDAWVFQKDGSVLRVKAPPLQPNEPALNVSELNE